MTTETCPNCGAEYVGKRRFSCGTSFNYDDTINVFDWCWKRQLAQKNVEIERLKQAVLDERDACARTASEYATFGYDGHQIAKAIRARGEVK